MTTYLNFHTGALFLTALVVGGMVFFSFVAAPTAFRALGSEHGGRYIRAVFPLYYRTMLACSLGAAILVYYRIDGWLLALVAGLFLFADVVLRPAINRYRDAHLAGDARARTPFRWLHGLSMLVNLVQLGIAGFVLLRLAA